MKTRSIIYMFSFLSLILFSNVAFAQTSNYDLITKELTKAQKELLQKEREVMKANREALKATLSKEQIAILRDKTISKVEIRRRLLASFSLEQKRLIRGQEIRLRNSREDFRRTLTEDQRKLLQERIAKIRNLKDRRELRDRVRKRAQDGGNEAIRDRNN